MPITGKFVADFEDFNRGAKEAAGQLSLFDVAAKRTGAGLGDVEASARKATPHVNDLSTSMRTFDGVLAAAGVHLGPEIRGLEDLAAASGKTATQLGAIATAGLVFGAAVGGWKIGRLISDFVGLDEAIGNATAKLLGWGDVAGQVAGAKQDTINLAIRNGALATISYTDAIAFNITTQTEKAAALKTTAAELKAAAEAEKAATIVANAAAAQMRENNAKKLRDLGVEMAANKAARDLEAAALLTTTRLWDEYHANRITHGGTANDAAIAQINRWAADTEAAAIKAGTATTAFYAALAANSSEKMAAVGMDWSVFTTKSIPALREVEANALKTYNAMLASGQFLRTDLEAQRKKWEEARDAARGYGQDATAAQDAAAAATQKATEKLEAQIAVAAKAKSENAALGGAYDITKATFQEYTGEWLARTWGVKDKGRLEGLFKMGFSFANAMGIYRTGMNPNDWQGDRGPRIPGYAAGGPVTSDGLIYAHAGEYVLPASGGGGGTTVINLVVDGQKLATIVNKHNTRAIMQGQKIGSA